MTDSDNHEVIAYQNALQAVFLRLQKLFPTIGDYTLRIIKRRTTKQRVLGYINLKRKILAIDVFTGKTFQLKKMSAVIRTLTHEITHTQKMPFYQRFRGRMIVRQHYPEFYQQLTINLETIKKDEALSTYFD